MTNPTREIFTWSLIALGAIVCAVAAFLLPYEILDLRFFGLAAFTILFGSRMSIPMPRSHVMFTMCDAMIFLTFLLYGGEAAILLAGVEALGTSLLLKRQKVISKYSTVLLNMSLMACATAGTYAVFQFFPLIIGRTPNYELATELVIVLGVMAIVQFIFNSGLASLATWARNGVNFWQTWSEKSFAASLAAVIGATLAGVMYRLIQSVDSIAIVIVASLIGLIYWTYRRYLAQIEESQTLAEQAERERAETERRRLEETEKHIEELSKHIAEQDRISEALRLSKERFQHAALHDALTGLPNRSFFFEQIRFLIERGRHTGGGFCVLFMDLDGFKKINDSLGHAVGDKLLIEVARNLENAVRHGDTVARLGGDEFAIVFNEINQIKDAISFAERITKSFAQPFRIDSHQVFTATSIGIAMSNQEYDTPEEILRDADIAMYYAKENRTGCSIFDRELRVRTVNTIQLETDLRYAIEEEQFRVYYQPIIALESGHLAGFEALVRWQHPQRGLIPPMEFIPIAETNGQIIPMTNWILWQACSQLSRWRWRSAVNRNLIISVNLSSKHFTQPDLVEQIKNTLHETGLDSRCLKLEITESAVMENAEEASQVLQSLRQIGVQLSIDDFGTGYSSLSYLHKFPIDTLKIDRSFVMRMSKDGENSEIVKTIITLAQNLGLDVIAEGVETIDQLEILRKLGCRYAQGYLFAKPLPQDEMDEIMKQGKNWLPDGVLPYQSVNNVVPLHTGRLAN